MDCHYAFRNLFWQAAESCLPYQIDLTKFEDKFINIAHLEKKGGYLT